MPHTIKGILSLVMAVEVVLGLTIAWLQKLSHGLSDAASLCLTVSGVIIAYYTALHLREKWKGQQLDNIIKKLDIEDRKKG